MGEVVNTLLRYISSKKIENIIMYVNTLPYKIEIKGNAVFDGKRWTLFFNLPETINQEIPSGKLD